MSPAVAYLALGSNLGDRAAHLRQALDALRAHFTLTAISTCYETEPAYVLDQPHFYNLVCRVTTKFGPTEVLHELKRIEQELGREPGPRFGPRVVDIDLLFYDDFIFDTPELTIPHPRLVERAFVLVPLAEIAPDLVHPIYGQTVRALVERLGDTTALVRQTQECTL